MNDLLLQKEEIRRKTVETSEQGYLAKLSVKIA